MATVVRQTAEGLVGEWAADFRLNYMSYWIYGVAGPRAVAGGEPSQKWQLGDKEDRRFGRHHESFADCLAEIAMYVQQDHECDTWDWFVGAEWRSDHLTGWPVTEEGSDDLRISNGETPGSAKVEAQRIYDLLCRESGAAGCCYFGRIDPETGGQKEEEICERDPGQEEDDRQQRHDEYLEQNHDAIVFSERYEQWRAEY